MAETCIVRIRDLPSRALRKSVQKFLTGGNVSVEDITGRVFNVALYKNRVVLRCNKEQSTTENYGKGDFVSVLWGQVLY